MKREVKDATLYLLAAIQKPVEKLDKGSTVVVPGALLVPVTGVVATKASEARTIFIQEHGAEIPKASLSAGEVEILCVPFGDAGGEEDYED